MRHVLFVSPVGELVTIGDAPPELELTGEVTRKRASSVVPVNRAQRAAFVALRCLFGERGRVAEWTRRWPGPWTAKLYSSGETYTHLSRRACIEWERQRLEEILCQRI